MGKKVSIQLLDISTLFSKLRIRRDDFVFLKMDVEGLEYDLVRRLLVTGILSNLIDKIAVEWLEMKLNVFHSKILDYEFSDIISGIMTIFMSLAAFQVGILQALSMKIDYVFATSTRKCTRKFSGFVKMVI